MKNEIIKIKIENTEDLEEVLKLISKGAKQFAKEKLEEQQCIVKEINETLEKCKNMSDEIMNGEETAEELKAVLESFKEQEKLYKEILENRK